jgi:hypothetical protein
VRGADGPDEQSIPLDEDIAGAGELAVLRCPAKGDLQPKADFATVTNEPGNGTRERVQATKVVRHGAAESVPGQGFEVAATGGFEPVDGQDETDGAGGTRSANLTHSGNRRWRQPAS